MGLKKRLVKSIKSLQKSRGGTPACTEASVNSSIGDSDLGGGGGADYETNRFFKSETKTEKV